MEKNKDRGTTWARQVQMRVMNDRGSETTRMVVQQIRLKQAAPMWKGHR